MNAPTRREVLASLMGVIGGGSGAAGCTPWSPEHELLRSLRASKRYGLYDDDERQLIGIVADAIIPRTDTPGAIDAGVPAYLEAMMKNWASIETRHLHRRSLQDIRAKLEELGGARRQRLTDDARRQAVAALDAQAYTQG